MNLREIEQEALALSEPDRAALVLSLMDTLVPVGTEVSDDGVLRRDEEMEKGEVAPMMHEEFVRRIQADRREGLLLSYRPNI